MEKLKPAEAGGVLYMNEDFSDFRVEFELDPEKRELRGIDLTVAPRKGEIAMTFHTHIDPFSYRQPSASYDLKTKFPGFVFDRFGGMWGFYNGAYQ